MTYRLFACFCLSALAASGATIRALPFDALVASSDTVVYARVVATQSFWDAPTATIWTRTTLVVLDAPKGSAGASIVVTEPGGIMGDVGHLVPGVPRFEAGQECVAFLYRALGARLRVRGLMQGVYTVAFDAALGERVARPSIAEDEHVYSVPRSTAPIVAEGRRGPMRLRELLAAVRARGAAR